MNKEFIIEINKILNEKEIDERIKPLIELYFSGKAENLTMTELNEQISTLCSKISNIEFSNTNIVVGYLSDANLLTVNKRLFFEGKADEVILPIFMKFETILNSENRRKYSKNIEDFINAGRLAKSLSIPISNRLYKLYEIAEYCYGDIEDKISIFEKDGTLKGVCEQYSNALNKTIISGNDNADLLCEGNLFHYMIFTPQNLKDPNFTGPYRNEQYQKKAAQVIEHIQNLNVVKNEEEIKDLIDSIKLYTGCTDEMVQDAKNVKYTGNEKISTLLQERIKANDDSISEDFIVSKVQSVLDKKTGWDSRTKHLVIPFFIRSQKIYNWDKDEFQERLNQLNLSVDQLGFSKLEGYGNTAKTSLNEIKLNSKVFLNNKR